MVVGSVGFKYPGDCTHGRFREGLALRPWDRRFLTDLLGAKGSEDDGILYAGLTNELGAGRVSATGAGVGRVEGAVWGD